MTKPAYRPFVILAIVLISIAGLILRIVSCFHGWPDHLHIDEPTVVKSTIDMLSRHSWEAHTYNRPDQLEIKVDSFLFELYSWVRYHMSAPEAFASHETDFYVVARLFTTIIGTATIPLVAVLCAKAASHSVKIEQGIASVAGATLSAFSSLLIEHASYATPDVVLSFLILVFTFVLAHFIERGGPNRALACAAIVGLAITVKYPGAVLSLPLAAAVIWRLIQVERRPMDVIPYAAASVTVVIAVVFAIAPNLITNISEVANTVRFEARDTHLGADGLGLLGNAHYYFRLCTISLGALSVPAFALGITRAIKAPSSYVASVAMVGVTYLVFFLKMPLHWDRWGIPVIYFFAVMASVGVAVALVRLTSRSVIGRLCAFVLSTLIFGSTLISGICSAKCATLPTIFTAAAERLSHLGITQDNALNESYTALWPLSNGRSVQDYFVRTQSGDIRLRDEFSYAEYLIIGTSHLDRMRCEPLRYRAQLDVYNAIDATYEHVLRIDGTDDWVPDILEAKNLIKGIAYLMSAKGPTGYICSTSHIGGPIHSSSVNAYRLKEE